MNPTSLVHLRKLLLPSSHSHWSATEPRIKTQPTATAHTQRKHTRHGCWQPKPVRPDSETGQTTSVGLSLTQAWETGQTGLTNRSDRFDKPVRPTLSRISPKTKNTSRAFPHLNKRSHGTTETSLLKILLDSPQDETGQIGLGNWSGRFLPGQSGRTQPAGKTQHFLQSISRFIPRIKVRLWG
jgi:hypothetical protein